VTDVVLISFTSNPGTSLTVAGAAVGAAVGAVGVVGGTGFPTLLPMSEVKLSAGMGSKTTPFGVVTLTRT